jgi:DnaD/phage-associated family protein
MFRRELVPVKAEVTIRMGKKRVPPLSISGEIFDVYQPAIGPRATLIWLNLRWLVHIGAAGNIEETLQNRTGFSFREVTESLSILTEWGLLEFAGTGEYVVNDPLSAEAFALLSWQKNSGTAVSEDVAAVPAEVGVPISNRVHPDVPPKRSAPEEIMTDDTETSAPTEVSAQLVESNAEVEPDVKLSIEPEPISPEVTPGASPLSRKNRRRIQPQATPPIDESEAPVKAEAKSEHKVRRTDGENRDADMDAVVEIYHKKIGMLGPTQFDKLKFWVKEQGMAGEVVALAIEETVQSAQNPRIQYLEGILRNWHNDGILTLQDLLKRKKASKVLSGGEDPKSPSMDGIPNAAAYRRVDPEMVKKWKELYPDEYDG